MIPGDRDMYAADAKSEKWNLARIALTIAVPIVTGILCFALGTVNAESASRTEIEGMRQDIQKIRAMPEPSQVVTKDQFLEMERRLDERTMSISQDVQYIRQQLERR
jgi:hypothetical protein